MDKQYKNIISATMARYLIKQCGLGKYLIDIKPHKDNKYRTVFTFELSDDVRNFMSVYHKSLINKDS